MSDRTHNFMVPEDDLATLESALSLIMREGVDWTQLNGREDIRDSWKQVKEILSNIRFDYGPPQEAHRVE